MKHARTGTNRKRKRKVDYEESSEEEEEVPFACKKCGKWTTDLSQNFEPKLKYFRKRGPSGVDFVVRRL